MSLTEQSVAQIQGENGTEYALIPTLTVAGEHGEVVQVVHHVASMEQENVDPQNQVFMLSQPITVTGENGESQVIQQQFILPEGASLEQLQAQGLAFDQQVLQLSSEAIHQPQILAEHLTQHPNDGTQQIQHVQIHQDGQNQQHIQIIEQQFEQHVQQQRIQQIENEPTNPIPVSKPSAPPRQEVKPPVGKGPFKCDHCDKVFPKWGQVQRHAKTHEDDKPFRCSKCPASFNVEDNLTLHMATHETDNPSCPECGKKFSRIASLKAHIMLHEKEENLICAECGDEFSTQVQLDRHMVEHREEEAGQKMYPCKQCTMEFTKLSLLRDHMKQHYKIKSSLSHRTYKRNIDRSGFSHKCTHCSKTFQKPSQLERHIRIHTGERPFRCAVCDKAFNQQGALQIHMTKHTGERPHQCEFCPSTFSQKGNLRAHIQRVHSHPKDGSTPLYQCDECSCVFRKLGSLNAHMSRAHSDAQDILVHVSSGNQIEGADPGKNVKDVIQQLLELSEQTTNAEGQQQVKVARADLLQQALENSGLAQSEGSPPDSAKIHGQVTEGQMEAIEVPPNQEAPPAGPVPTAELSHAIPTNDFSALIQGVPQNNQDKSCAVISTLTIHDAATGTIKKHIIRKVNGVRWHQCLYCTKEFKKPSDLIRHIRIHTHEKPYKCNLCFRAFAVKSTLTAHVKTHAGLKEFQCHRCDKMFSTQGSLKVHLRLHTGAKPFECPHCDKKFRTSGHRKSHIASHLKQDSPKKARRPIKRPPKPDVNLPDVPLQEPILITDTGLIQQSSRNSMFNQFLGETSSVDRPFKCGYCSRGFKKSSHLKQHIRSHTGEKPYTCLECHRCFVSSGVLKAHIRTHTGVKAYKCLLCDTTFTTNGSLKRHMSTHSDVRPFMCPYCQKTFKTSVNCKKHMKTHKHELAMQALQQQQPDGTGEVAETEVTIGHEVPDVSDDDEDNETIEMHTQEVTTQIEVSQANDLTLQQAQLTQEHQAATLALQQQDLGANMGQVELVPQQTIHVQDALVTDVQLQNALQQPLIDGQQGLSQQQTLNQSLLTNNVNNQPTFNQLNYNQGQFLQTQGTGFDVGSISSLTNQQAMPPSSLSSTSMQNILQTNEVELNAGPENWADDGKADGDEGKRQFKCDFCQKGFKKSSHLKQHIRSHTGEKPYQCNQCSRHFVSMGVLKQHLRTHSGLKEFKCQMCTASFTTNGSLTRHMMIHSSVRPYKCNYCNETFRTALNCKRHMKAHKEAEENDDEPVLRQTRRRSNVIQLPEEQAEALSKQLPDPSMTVSEKLLIESAAEIDRISEIKEVNEVVQEGVEESTASMPVPTKSQQQDSKYANICPTCHKSFKKPSDLVRHLRIHSGEKPYVCDTCRRTFTVKSTLDSHMKTHRSGGTEKVFKCHVCGHGFSTKGSLKVHMRLHTGAKPFKCPHCDQRFRTSGHRKSHIAQHFKPNQSKKRKTRDIQLGTVLDMNQPAHQTQIVDHGLANQVINVDQSLLQNQGALPVSLSITDPFGNMADGNLAAQMLQGMEGVQLQLTGNLAQGIQIQGLDPNILSQTVQIDASLLQQLQQQGNINVTLNPGVHQAVDPNQIQTVQNVQVQQASVSDVVNPNVVIQSFAQPQHQLVQTQVETTHAITVPEGLLNTHTVSAQPSQILHTSVSGENIMAHITQATEQHDESIDDGADSDPEDDGEMVEGVSEELHFDLGEAVKGEQHHAIHLLSQDGASRMDLTDPQRTHVCQVCGKGFKRSGHLKEHMQTHGPGPSPSRMKPTPHKCSECDKAFAKPSQLERHVRIHTGERPFHCQICNKSFNQKNALQVHLKKHSGEKPHKCPYCEQAFTQKGNLKTHIKRAHHQEMVQSMNLPKGSDAGDEDPGQEMDTIEEDGKEDASTVQDIDLERVLSDF